MIVWYPTKQYSAQIEYLKISFAIMTPMQCGPCPFLPIQGILCGNVSRLKQKMFAWLSLDHVS